MTGADALARQRAAGVDLWLEGETLRYRAPAEALTADRLGWLKANREALAEALLAPTLSFLVPALTPRIV